MENIKILSDDVLTKVRRSIKLVNSIEEADKLIKYINKMIKYLDKIIKNGLKTDTVECVCELEENLNYLNEQKKRIMKKNKSIKQKMDLIWIESESSFDKRIQTGVIINLKYKDPKIFFDNAFRIFFDEVKKKLEQNFVKINVKFSLNFILPWSNEIRLKEICTRSVVMQGRDDINVWYRENIYDELINKLTEFDENDSGWTLHEILSLKINFYEYCPLSGKAYIELPKEIRNKRAVINVKNYDNYCFLWAILSALYPVKSRSDLISSYPHFSKVLKYDSIDFPMKLEDIPKFENLNNLSINVYTLEGKEKIVPIYLSKFESEKQISLLLFHNGIYNEGEVFGTYSRNPLNNHYAWIKNLSRLISKQITRRQGRVRICFRCLNHFGSDEGLEKHLKICDTTTKFAFNLPSDDEKILKFRNFHKKEKLPFVVYLNFDCIKDEKDPFIITLYFKCSYDDSLSFFECFRGNNCGKLFIDRLKQIVKDLQETFNKITQMKPLTENQKFLYENSSFCHICENIFNENDVKVRDWCHFTGNYRGAAHRVCDLNYRTGKVIPIIYHNFSKNSKFLIQLISTNFKGNETLIKTDSFSKYIDKNGIILRLMDSKNFIYDSIEKIGYDLMDRDKKITRSYFQDFYKFQLFPEINSFEELDEKFDDVSTLGEHSEIYFKFSVLLLSDIFENFRDDCLKNYKLDPLRYHSISEFAYDSMLWITKIELELLTDAEKILFIENGIRGGLSQVSCRYAKANNKYMESYTVDEPDSFLIYFGVNRINDCVMSKKLPYKNFEWVDYVDLDKLSEDDDYGYIFQVDLEYPMELHRMHNDLPLCPEKIRGENSKFSKLIANLYSKQNYIIHYMNLKQCIDLGMKLTKIHKILRFRQSDWLRPFIELNDELKKNSDEFSRNFYTLITDCVFDQFVGDFKSYFETKFVKNWESRFGAKFRISKPNFHSCDVIDENSVVVEMNKTSIKFNKPIYIGFTLSELIKNHIYDFHYNFIKSNFGLDVKLLYMDKDSLIYNFMNSDVYEVILKNLERFDTSNYLEDNRFKIPVINKDGIGFIQDRLAGRVLCEFIGFKSKMYSIRIEGDEKIEENRKISFSDFIDCFSNNIENFKKCNNIVVYTTKQKQGLMIEDDKRRICDDNINTLAWGYES